ncbi:hypothetical protein A0H81_01771 [Grifola frondosa]|uniref:Uncharacterized protein n=1 Tax=Grifola frondosa TaxID=5627 RepID=A0A1C7MMW6_GRIFR|nr:hypothetical protein A0H81_01771 [Grifola frondosa]
MGVSSTLSTLSTQKVLQALLKRLWRHCHLLTTLLGSRLAVAGLEHNSQQIRCLSRPATQPLKFYLHPLCTVRAQNMDDNEMNVDPDFSPQSPSQWIANARRSRYSSDTDHINCPANTNPFPRLQIFF